MKQKLGNLLVILGICMITAAGIFFGYNAKTERDAIRTSAEAVAHIYDVLEQRSTEDIPDASSSTDVRTGDVVNTSPAEPEPETRPTEMPVVNVDGTNYVASVCIPSLNIELPVANDPTTDNLWISPVRYKGSAYTDDLIIAAHNFETFFGKIKNLVPGDAVRVTDMNGATFEYEVSYLETIDGYDMQSLFMGDWDLTLLTCTYGGISRVLARCVRVPQPETQATEDQAITGIA